ncbi:MAG: hypothetical protein RJA44_760 [Pseudomonadota bacterium]
MVTVRSLLRDEVAETFAAEGPLARADAQFRPREAQSGLADAVAQALEERSVLVAEAGTGVGKTYAYLVPLLLSGQRALVSTATKSLQDQLHGRDLPRLVARLGLPVQIALLKGRSSYLCLHRLELARHGTELPDAWSTRLLARVEEWARITRSGDLAELEVLDERSPVIPLVSSTRDNCLGADCPSFRQCHVVQARREAMQADIVVINHHLFFADLTLRDTGMAELLPRVDAVVFDEAHQLNEAGVQFLGRSVGSAQLMDYARDLIGAGQQHARGLRAWPDLAAVIEQAARELRLACAGPLRSGARLRWEERADTPALQEALQKVQRVAFDAAEALQDVAPSAPDLARLLERAQQLGLQVTAFRQPVAAGHVRWIDLTLHHARLTEAPLDIRATMQLQIAAAPRAWIFTSATLGADERLSWFTRSTGLEEARTLRVGSPFDYAAHARLLLPRPFPKPAEAAHMPAVAALAGRLATRLGGRTFVLTTTLRSVQGIGAALQAQLGGNGASGGRFDVLVQGQAPKRALLQRFLAAPRAVLVGSHSFWEGIDVPGAALQCVVIDKLPFPPPGDPLVEARIRSIEAEGGDAFNDYSLPEAAIALKQGAGRLIRSESDRGLLVICDPRLAAMSYGRRLRAALPPMTLCADEAEALAWLDELAAYQSPQRLSST